MMKATRWTAALLSLLLLCGCGGNVVKSGTPEPAEEAENVSLNDTPETADETPPEGEAAAESAAVPESDSALPEIHVIAYPEDLPTLHDEYGADAFDGSLNQPDSRYYVFNDFYHMESGDGLHILTGFETYQQTTEYSCGSASVLMVLHWFGVDDYDEASLEEPLGVDAGYYGDGEEPPTGTAPESVAAFFTALGWTVEGNAETVGLFQSETEFEAYVIEQIDAGVPVLVDWTDWGGHWQVIVGLDECGTDSPFDDVLILADPYDITDHYQDGYYTFPLGRFCAMWQEGPAAQKAEPCVQPFVTARPS